MSEDPTPGLALETSCFVNATPEQVFDAWTTPAELMKWWGPNGVRCREAVVDLRVGGQYRIRNELPDRSTLWISGEYERIDVPRLLTFSWRIEDGADDERVTVRFVPEDRGTRVTVRHERIGSRALRDQHLAGWDGCLAGLARHLDG